MELITRFCFDIDDTICSTQGLDYQLSTPKLEVVSAIQELKRSGAYIILYTARGSKSGIDFRALTEEQLSLWGVPYDELHLGKPFADVYIDDKAINALDWHESGCPNPKVQLFNLTQKPSPE